MPIPRSPVVVLSVTWRHLLIAGGKQGKVEKGEGDGIDSNCRAARAPEEPDVDLVGASCALLESSVRSARSALWAYCMTLPLRSGMSTALARPLTCLYFFRQPEELAVSNLFVFLEEPDLKEPDRKEWNLTVLEFGPGDSALAAPELYARYKSPKPTQ